jgi:hypothetical protein
MSDFTIVAFDRDRHGPFVLDTFAKSIAKVWPYSLCAWRPLVDELKRTLASPDARALVAELPVDSDAFLGWSLTVPKRNEVVFAYTRHSYRRQWGICSGLILAGGIEIARPTPVRFWTRASERIRLRPGYEQLYHRVTEEGQG